MIATQPQLQFRPGSIQRQSPIPLYAQLSEEIKQAIAAGVNGLIYQAGQEQLLNEEIFHSSMGTIARIPLVKMGIFEALRDLKRDGIKIYSLEMEGTPYFKENLTGPVALVLASGYSLGVPCQRPGDPHVCQAPLYFHLSG